MIGALIILAVVVLIAAGGYLSHRRTQKRLAAFAEWARTHQYTYRERDERYDDPPWGSPFGLGDARRATDVLEGTCNGRPALAFTHHYQEDRTGSDGETETAHNYHRVFALTLPKVLPELTVGTEDLFTRIARAVGVHDIELESEDFNKAFCVHADNRKFAYDVLNPQLMQWLLDNRAPGFHIVDGHIVFVEQGKLRLDEVDARLHYLDAIVASIQPFVWDAH